MARACTVCTHPHRAEIDAALVAGEAFRLVAGRHGLALSSLFRHKASHIRAVVPVAEPADQGVPPHAPNVPNSPPETGETSEPERRELALLAVPGDREATLFVTDHSKKEAAPFALDERKKGGEPRPPAERKKPTPTPPPAAWEPGALAALARAIAGVPVRRREAERHTVASYVGGSLVEQESYPKRVERAW